MSDRPLTDSRVCRSCTLTIPTSHHIVFGLLWLQVTMAIINTTAMTWIVIPTRTVHACHVIITAVFNGITVVMTVNYHIPLRPIEVTKVVLGREGITDPPINP